MSTIGISGASTCQTQLLQDHLTASTLALEERISWFTILELLTQRVADTRTDFYVEAALHYCASTALLFENTQGLGYPSCTLGNVVAAVGLLNPRELLFAIATSPKARNYAMPLLNCLEVGAMKQINSVVEIARRIIGPLLEQVASTTRLEVVGCFKTSPFDIRQGIEEQLDENKQHDFFAAAGLNYITAVGLLIEEGEAKGYPPCTPRTVAAAVKLIDPAQLLPHIAHNSSARAVVAPLLYSFQSAASGATEQLNGVVTAARALVSPLLTGFELEAQRQVVQRVTSMLGAPSTPVLAIHQ